MTEAFFEGFESAEKRYRLLIETVEELDKKSADAIHIHNDGTLEVKVPNAQKVGRVLVVDTDSHIGGGLFYSDDAVQLKQTDTLIIADALRYLINDEERHELDRATAESLREQILKYGASMCKGGAE